MTARQFLKHPIVAAVVVSVVMSAYQEYRDKSRSNQVKIDGLPDKEWMRENFANKSDVSGLAYRVAELENDQRELDRRQRGIVQSLQTVCVRQDTACPVRNAMYRYPPIPSWPNVDIANFVAVNTKRREVVL